MLPGAKEEYMSKLSEFITNNQDELQIFYDDLLVCLLSYYHLIAPLLYVRVTYSFITLL